MVLYYLEKRIARRHVSNIRYVNYEEKPLLQILNPVLKVRLDIQIVHHNQNRNDVGILKMFVQCIMRVCQKAVL